MNKAVGIVLLIIGIISFIVSMVFLFPIPDHMRILLILVTLAILAIEAVKDWKTFIDKLFKFGITFLAFLFTLIFLYIYLGLSSKIIPSITILAIVMLIIFIGYTLLNTRKINNKK